MSSGSRLPVKLVADMFGVDPGKVVAIAIALIYDTLCTGKRRLVTAHTRYGHHPDYPVPLQREAR